VEVRWVDRRRESSSSGHVRLDEGSEAALDVIRAEGLSDSEAVRTALREAAARRRTRSATREEVRRLAADEADRDEMRLIREQLAALAPSPLAD
jgi:Arc/MetJ-type ribon-helix-helix transcriptional regulator